MKFNCPYCLKELISKNEGYSCKNGHFFESKNGVIRLMKDDFIEHLDDFLETYNQHRKGSYDLLNKQTVKALPYVSFEKSVWKLRQLDLKLVNSLLPKNKGLKILDFGSWNGWLAHQLAKNHDVLALDYFNAPFDGLETVNFYDKKYTAVQADLTDLKILNQEFDVVVVNRCIAYFDDVEGLLKSLKSKIKKGGKVVLIGLLDVKDKKLVSDNLNRAREEYLKKYGKPMEIYPMKGYLANEDFETIKQEGFTLKKQLYLSLKAKIRKPQIKYFYGVYEKT